ncbi:unnamed protein product [Effrenium voratum]|nr:unnamed protein product [Effrenium voratum]
MADAKLPPAMESLSQDQLHKSRACRPCLFFTRKEDGCWKGDACDHCHICDQAEAKARRNRISWRGRKQRRQAERALREAEKLKAEQEEGKPTEARKQTFWL